MNKQELIVLADKILKGEASVEEIALYNEWFNAAQNTEPKLIENPETKRVALLARIQQDIHPQRNHVRRLVYRIAVAASVIFFLSAGGYFLLHKQTNEQVTQNNDVLPGTGKAILKTGHGKMILLDSVAKGLITQQGNTVINKTNAGQLVYANLLDSKPIETVYDTLQIPAGGKIYHLTLSDGSKLILNAATTLRFPEVFTDHDRQVDLLSGEAYFDVAHNAARPFHVKTTSQMIEDIGTQFNVNAYPDEKVTQTTLISGIVRVAGHTLKPGQQANTNNLTNNTTLADADLEEVTAWKDGVFRYNGTHLESIMKQVSRWYDVKVVYEDESVKSKNFFAFSTRFAKASDLLNKLEQTGGVKFKIEGKKITVMKK